MVRILVSYVLPLLLPTAMYFLWAAWVRRRIEAEHAQNAAAGAEITAEEVERYEIRTPWFRLILAGVGLMTVGLMIGVLFSPKNPPDSVYQPPREVDGQIVPGQYVPKPEDP